MARKKQPDRVICIEDRGGDGPKRFRVHFVRGGKRVARGFPTLADAQESARKYEVSTAPLRTETVDDLITRYKDDMLARGLWQADAKALSRKVPRLRNFLAPVIDFPIGLVTPASIAQCCEAWDASPARTAYNTRRDARIKAQAFLRWCVKQKLIRACPLTEAHHIKFERPKKLRLRIDDTRRLRAKIDPAALQADTRAAWVLTCLLLGPRSSELVGATVRNLDDAGRVISYLDAKDKVTLHEVRMPRVLVDVMAALAGRAQERGDGLLFGPEAAGRYWAAESVRLWCEIADIDGWEEMDTRWLRRTKDTIAVESGVAAEVVARETGHTLNVARRNYIGAGAETSGRAAALEEMTAPAGTDSSAIGTKIRKPA